MKSCGQSHRVICLQRDERGKQRQGPRKCHGNVMGCHSPSWAIAVVRVMVLTQVVPYTCVLILQQHPTETFVWKAFLCLSLTSCRWAAGSGPAPLLMNPLWQRQGLCDAVTNILLKSEEASGGFPKCQVTYRHADREYTDIFKFWNLRSLPWADPYYWARWPAFLICNSSCFLTAFSRSGAR